MCRAKLLLLEGCTTTCCACDLGFTQTGVRGMLPRFINYWTADLLASACHEQEFLPTVPNSLISHLASTAWRLPTSEKHAPCPVSTQSLNVRIAAMQASGSLLNSSAGLCRL